MLDLLSPSVEIGLVTTNLDAMVEFYEGFLGLDPQDLGDVAAKVEAAGYQIVEPPTEFAPVPGMGWMFIADPDGNSIELFGTM